MFLIVVKELSVLSEINRNIQSDYYFCGFVRYISDISHGGLCSCFPFLPGLDLAGVWEVCNPVLVIRAVVRSVDCELNRSTECESQW